MSFSRDLKKEQDTMQEIADCCSCAVEELEDMYACTPLQEGMMAITFKDPVAYTVEYTYQLPSDIEPRRFRQAWVKVAQANPILRTRIVSTTRHGCTQVVVKRNPPWRTRNSEQSQQNSNELNWEMGSPLVCFTLESDRNDQYTLKVLIHHALCEDWSMALLLHQVELAYKGEELMRCPFRPFIEYIEKQQSKAIQYWDEMFKNADHSDMKTFPLPKLGYQPRPTATLNHIIALDEHQDNNYSLNTKMRLSWAILQSLYTGTSDTLFGAIDSGRAMAAPGIETLTGPTLACIPVRINLNNEDLVVYALEAVRTQWLAEMEFGQVGLQNLLHLGPGPAAACQFQTLLAIEPSETHVRPGMFSAKKEVQKEYDTYPLILRCRNAPQGVTIEAHFDPAVVTDKEIERVFQQLENIYQQVNQESEIQIGKLSTLSPQDETDLKKLNIPIRPPASKIVHEIIRNRVDQCPEALAVASWDGNMTFKELDNISSTISSQLVQRGVRRANYVAVCVEKGKWMPIAMLSVMKAGGAFVLLDPSHPPARLKEIWRQIDARVIITSKSHLNVASELPGEVFRIEEASTTSESITAGNQELSTATPADPVYVTFTSGSTGKPKGAIVHHDGFSSSALDHGKLYGFTPKSRVLQFASPAFDSCIIENLTTLMFGGCVCIPTDSDCHSSLSSVINEFDVNVACLTPTVARILSPDTLVTLESLVFVGEAVLPTDVKQWETHVNVRNAYGPAECSAVFSVQPNLKAGDASNIGFPTGCVGWIVHPADHEILMPIGCIGELLIEGPTVGKGYLQNPSQTAEAFITPPSWRQHFGDGGGKLYKTGDLVRYATPGDGSICYLGRKGTQVKFHGQRIEMADIEHHLRLGFPDSQQVIAEMLPLKEPLLVAFIYMPDSSPTTTENNDKILFDQPGDDFRSLSSIAQDNMLNSLPQFMVPRVFLPLAHIPLTASSKTDRRALREHAASLSWDKIQIYRASSTAPRRESTQSESLLQSIWAQTLNRKPEEMGLNESFFRLGGDSVSAMQISASCQASGFRVTVADIMNFPTIAQLAEMLKLSNAKSTPSVHPRNGEIPTGKWFDLSPIQELFFEKTPEGHDGFTQQFLLRISQPIETSKIQKAMETVVQQHSMLRACYERSQDGEWKQHILQDDETPSFFREYSVPSAETCVLQKILSDSQNTMDIRKGKVLAVDLIRTPKEQYLSVMAHHLVIDLVSWRVLLQDLEDILTTDAVGCLPSLSFQQWCRLQQLYSKECLDPSTAIPGDIPSPPLNYWGSPADLEANTWGKTKHESISISEDTTRAILGYCNDAFHTRPVEIIHTAIVYAFSQVFNDRPTPTIFSEGHGREPWDPEIDISRTIGWFTTMVPFFVNAQRGQPIEDVLVQVKERRRSMPSNGWEYFASRYLHEDGSKYCESHEPMEILFNYTGLFQQLERSDALLQLATLPDHELVPIPSDLPRFALIDVSATAVEGCLHISFWHNQNMEHSDRLNKWIHGCVDVLEGLPAALRQHGHFTLSDFPLLSLKKESDLQQLIGQINENFKVEQRNIQDIYPLSPIQLGMWLSQLKTPDMYWSRMEWLMSPTSESVPIDLDKCREAWQSTVNRHPILRTVFTEDVNGLGQPVQVVLHHVTADIHVGDPTSSENEDFSSMDTNKERLGKVLHKISLIKQADGKLLCKLSIHHMLVDGATRNLILSDFRKAHDEGLGDNTGVPYSSFLTHLRDRDGSQSVKHWKNYLQGTYPCIFPPLGTLETEQEILHSVPLHFPFSKNLQKFCRQRGITVSNLFQIAWGLVLRAYTGSDAVCFGYLASGRDIELQDAHYIAGPMTNLLICRLTLDEDATIKSTLVENQGAYARSLGNQHFALADVVHSLGLSGESLFNTAMSLQKGDDDIDPAHSHITKLDLVGGCDHTEYPLTVNLTIGNRDIHGDLSFKTDIISDTQAEFVADAFQQAVKQLLNPENNRLSDIEMFGSANESHYLKLNRRIPLPALSCIHTKIHENASASPGATAVEAWNGGFTYGELNNLSSCLAAYLARKGVMPETFVAICCEKSRWIVVAILAVLKAGGAFILLDPSHPLERLQENLKEDFDCPLILATSSRADKASRLAPRAIIVDNDLNWTNKFYGADVKDAVSPNSAAYAIFTSGSTGKPKASIIEHQSFLSAAEAHCNVLRLGPDSRVFQFASYAFDASIVEILSTLLAGGCVCIPSESDRQSRLQKCMRNLSVNWTLLTPSVARLLDPEDLPSLKTLVLGGEGMSHEDVRRWRSHVALINAYGPSECSVIATAQPSSDALASNPANIGQPVGAVAWVVHPQNPNLRIPTGALGELLIEGPIVGRGYRNRPLLAKLANPDTPGWLESLRGTSDCRLYRTGDLVRCLPDGSLHYLGRKDRQVKLNGQRLELHEVEYHVQRCFPGAPEVFASMAKPENGGSSYLVASIHMASDSADTPSFSTAVQQAKALLDKEIPGFLIPVAMFHLREVPRMRNGKIDITKIRLDAENSFKSQSLALTDKAKYVTEKELTQTECSIRALWSKVLKRTVTSIGPDDHFFRLGGDSVGVMKVASSAGAENLQITAGDLFLHPILRDLAEVHMKSLSQREAAEPLLPFNLLQPQHLNEARTAAAAQCNISNDQIEDIFPCTPLQAGLVALTAEKADAYVAQHRYQLPADIDLNHLKDAWQRTSIAHPILRTKIVGLLDLGCLQVVIRDHDLDWRITKDKPEALLKAGDIFGKSLIRLNVVCSNPDAQDIGQHTLVLMMHHALYDAFSLLRIMDCARLAYKDKARDLVTPAPFQRFVKYTSSHSESILESWSEQLKNLSATPFPSLPAPSYRPGALSRQFTSLNTGEFLEKSVTKSTAIAFSWAITQSQYQSTEDVVFGMVSTGRRAPVIGIETMTGPTIATAPLRVLINSDETVGQGLESLQTRMAQMVSLEQAGLSQISKLGPEGELACSFQTLLNIESPTSDAEEGDEAIMHHIDTIAGKGAFSTYALQLTCTMKSDVIDVEALFDDNVVSPWQMQCILHQFSHILELVCQFPESLIRDVPVLNTHDHHQLEDWNSQGSLQFPATVTEMIAQHFNTQPLAPAVMGCDEIWSYQDLEEMAGKLVTILDHHNVGADTLLPIYMERSPWTIVAILGVIQVGAAFVLLDTSHPISRLQSICYQIKPPLILTGHETSSPGRQFAPITIVVDKCTDFLEQPWTDCFDRPIYPDQPLYTVFTSGSTGQPKGVVIEHGAFVTMALACARRIGLSCTSRLLQVASYAFDVSIGEILGALISGGCICNLTDSDRREGLPQAVTRMQPTHAIFTPSLLRVWSPSDLQGIETIVITGEPARQSDIREWADKVILFNNYGPAECTVFSTSQGPLSTDSAATNIGFPLAGHAWLAHRQDPNKPIPVGAVGEILLQGPLVGRGYLNNPDKSAAVFLPTPRWVEEIVQDADANSARVYRTGDLARFERDGSLVYLGRCDSQAKLRGQRFELREVEENIQRHFPGKLRDVIAEVITPSRKVTASCLVAFLVSDESNYEEGSSPATSLALETAIPLNFKADISSLKLKQKETLPDYMIPSIFVPLAQMPHTVGGKVDRRRLRDATMLVNRQELESFAPANTAKEAVISEDQRLLQGIWSRALGTPATDIGADDSFFRLGGDSISALQATSQARAKGIMHSVADLFRLKSIGKIALEFPASSNEAPVVTISDRQDVQESEIDGAVYPCTPAQKAILLSQVQDQASYAPRFLWKVSMEGSRVDIQRLASAWQKVVSRHPALRITFHPDESQQDYFKQVVKEAVEAPVSIVPELSDMPPGLSGPITSLGQIPHYLTIYRTPGDDVICCLDINHAIIDAMSISILENDLRHAYHYESLSPHGKAYELYVKLALQQSPDHARKYFASYLDGISSPARLPTPCSTAANSITNDSADSLNQIDMNLSCVASDIESFCRRTDWTLPNVMYFAWALTLSSFTGSQDVCFGTLTSGRHMDVPKIVDAVGQFSNMSVCRVRLLPDSRLDKAALDLQEHYGHVLSHQTFPLLSIARAAGVTVDEIALTAVNVQYGNSAPSQDLSKDLLTLKPLSGRDPTIQDIMLYLLVEESGNIRVCMSHCLAHVSSELATQLAQYFDLAVRAILRKKDCQINDLQIFSEADKQLLRSWNPTLRNPDRVSIHELIQRRAQEQTSDLAVSGWDGDFTYKDLELFSNEAAAALVARGCKLGDRVPVCFEKTRWAIIAILAVMKAGATFVPLDPTHPLTRLREVCQRVNAKLIVSSNENAPLSQELVNNVFVLNDACAGRDQMTPISIDDPDQAAYILFTSGSTGTPKGVVICHSAYTYAAKEHIQAFSLSANSRVLQFSSYTFDVAVMEILTTLIAGGTVCIISDTERSEMLLKGECPRQVTHAFLTPSLASSLDPSRASWLQTLVFLGEPLSPGHIHQWHDSCQLINAYGPTEGSVINTTRSSLCPGTDAPNIGWPVGVHCWVVDPQNHERLLPLGATGELMLCGPSLAHGYLDQQHKTKESFPSPPHWLSWFFDPIPSCWRFYKTGDLVRYHIGDGSLRFEGRKDEQVKVRGQRIELGDIEYHTQRCFPGAREVVVDQVAIPQNNERTSQLIAWVYKDSESLNTDFDQFSQRQNTDKTVLETPDRAFHIAAATALADLREALPSYMIPEVFLPVSWMPLMNSGKTDRKQLKEVTSDIDIESFGGFAGKAAEKRPVETETESKLHSILVSLLELETDEIGIEDSFFHLGGDSILAMKLAVCAREQGLKIASHDILRHPTIRHWGQIIDNVDEQQTSKPQKYRPFSLIEDSDRQIMMSMRLSNGSVEDILPALESQVYYIQDSSPVSYVHMFSEPLDLHRLRQACMKAVNEYSNLRSIFVTIKDRMFQVILRNVEPVFEFVEDEDLEEYMTRMSRKKLVPATVQGEMPVRFTIVTAPGRPQWVFIAQLSHAQYDGGCLGFFWEAIKAAYSGDELPPVTDFRSVVHQRRGNDNRESLSFWRQYLSGSCLGALDPMDLFQFPGPTEKDTPPRQVRREIPKPNLLQEITVANLVKAALSWILFRDSKLSDIVLGQVVHGRGSSLPGIEKAFGPCVSFLPIRIFMEQSWTVADLLQHVQMQQLATIPHDLVCLGDIAMQSTDWGKDAKFGVLVHHQGLGSLGCLEIEGVCSSSTAAWGASRAIPGQVTVFSVEQEESLDLMIAGPVDALNEEKADRLANELAKAIGLLSSGLNLPLDKLSSENGLACY